MGETERFGPRREGETAAEAQRRHEADRRYQAHLSRTAARAAAAQFRRREREQRRMDQND